MKNYWVILIFMAVPVIGIAANTNNECEGLRTQAGVHMNANENRAGKDFDSILSDYEFFASHSTEAEIGKNAVISAINISADKKIDFLDFGGGDGKFSLSVIAGLSQSPQAIRYTVMDPSTKSLEEAKKNSEAVPLESRRFMTNLSDLPQGELYDVILANHVFYYVEDLRENIQELARRLKVGGKIIAIVATNDNDLIKYWHSAFAHLGMPVPYNLYPKIEAEFNQLNMSMSVTELVAETRFADSRENRLKMSRFLTGSYAGRFNSDVLASFFNSYQEQNSVHMRIVDRMIVAERLR